MAGFWRRLLPAMALGVTATLLLVSCASTGSRYVKNSDDGVYFKIPRSWELYDEDTLIEAEDNLTPADEEILREIGWLVGFDAAPKPSLDHLGVRPSKHPTGTAQVSVLDPDEREIASLQYLRNVVVPVDDIIATDDSIIQVLDIEEINDDAHRGVHFVFTVRFPDEEPVTIDQTALLDDDTRQLFLLVIGCEAQCYKDNEGTIGNVVESWTVRET
jgi:hypothetical protein